MEIVFESPWRLEQTFSVYCMFSKDSRMQIGHNHNEWHIVVFRFVRTESIMALMSLSAAVSLHWTCWQSVCILCTNTVCNVQWYSATSRPANQYTACNFSSHKVAVICFTNLMGYTNADDKARFESFLRRSSKLVFRVDSAPTLASICAEADDKLSRNVLYNDQRSIHYPTSSLQSC